MLDLTSLEKAWKALGAALEVYADSDLPDDDKEKTVLRDGVIQRFEFTFELSWKMLRRYLKEYGLEQAHGLSNRDLFRIGCEQGLIHDAEKWFAYLKARNMTSHAYDDAKATQVFNAAREFALDAGELIRRLKEKMG